MKSSILILFAMALMVATLPAQLRFESTVASHEAGAGEEKVSSVFKFINGGNLPVRITQIQTSCGCLRAVADQNLYLPGQSGSIETEFNVAASPSAMSKIVTVHTDSPGQSQIKLMVEVNARPILEVQPKMISWTVGEERTPKRISFKVLREQPIRVLKVTPSNASVTAKIHTLVEGKSYEVELIPSSTDRPSLGMVRIETDCDVTAQKNQTTFFRVSAAAPSPGR